MLKKRGGGKTVVDHNEPGNWQTEDCREVRGSSSIDGRLWCSSDSKKKEAAASSNGRPKRM